MPVFIDPLTCVEEPAGREAGTCGDPAAWVDRIDKTAGWCEGHKPQSRDVVWIVTLRDHERVSPERLAHLAAEDKHSEMRGMARELVLSRPYAEGVEELRAAHEQASAEVTSLKALLRTVEWESAGMRGSQEWCVWCGVGDTRGHKIHGTGCPWRLALGLCTVNRGCAAEDGHDGRHVAEYLEDPKPPATPATPPPGPIKRGNPDDADLVIT